jgi:histidinol-phosphatase
VQEDLELALALADEADRMTMAGFRSAGLRVETKPDLTPVTQVDRGVEDMVRNRLAEVRPGDSVLGEEFGATGEGAVRWILDPIDGTKNYVRGVPIFATLIAVERDGRSEVGVASAPGLGRRWWASRGEGAFAGGAGRGDAKSIHVSDVTRFEDAQLCFGGLSTWRSKGLLEAFLDLSRRCWRSRGFGDFWMHMLVAEGSAEIAAEAEVSLWDLAAVSVIVEEAGGRFTDFEGRARADGGTAISTNGVLHDEVLRALGANATRVGFET